MVNTTRYLIYERDQHGAPYAVEFIDAVRWDNALLEPPPPERADVRVVRLGHGAPPADIPGWLAVQPPGHGVAETGAAYTSGAPHSSTSPSDDTSTAAVGRALWPWSPYHREPGASLAEFLAAGSAALRHPDPSPAETRRQLELIVEFAGERAPPLARIATLRGDALERWLHHAFEEPGRFAETLLLARIGDEAPREVHKALRFLATAEAPDDAPTYAELSIDQRVLREQASPWRYLDGVPFAGALAAAQAWRRRYRLAHEAHYRTVLRHAHELREQLRQTSGAAAALELLDGIPALGEAVGATAGQTYAESVATLEVLPPDPDPGEAQTAGVALGWEPAAFVEAASAMAGVQRALEIQRRRLASRAVRIVLERRGACPRSTACCRRSPRATSTASSASSTSDWRLTSTGYWRARRSRR